MFLHDTVSKCVCSGLQKLINYACTALWCHGVSSFTSLSKMKKKKEKEKKIKHVFHPFLFSPLLSGFCSQHVSLGAAFADSYGVACLDITGDSLSKKGLEVN